MDTEDNSTGKKETTVKMMAQKMAKMKKKRKGGRADAGHNPDEKRMMTAIMKMMEW